MQQTIENKKVIQIGKISDIITYSSTVIGTIILILYFIPIKDFDFIMIIIGYGYVIIALIINILMLLTLIISIFYFQIYWKYFLTRIGILLINIPIAVLYFFIVINSENLT